MLNEYSGSILFTYSHDRYFIDAVADTIWNVSDGTIEKFDGTYIAYAAFIESREQKAGKERPGNGKPAAGGAPASAELSNAARRYITPFPPRWLPWSPPASRKSASASASAARSGRKDSDAGGRAQADRGRYSARRAGGRQKWRVTNLGIQYAELRAMLSTRYDEWAAVARFPSSDPPPGPLTSGDRLCYSADRRFFWPSSATPIARQQPAAIHIDSNYWSPFPGLISPCQAFVKVTGSATRSACTGRNDLVATAV